ncbi:MAG TPA: DarT ssDNA thymidine ADP-ribosyltransferase family protein [Thermoanaerobaculia bacterium]
MAVRPEERLIYHITDVENLPAILTDGGLYSDAVMSQRHPTLIGHNHIKERRLTEIRVPELQRAVRR